MRKPKRNEVTFVEIFHSGRWQPCSPSGLWDDGLQRPTRLRARRLLQHQRKLYPTTKYRLTRYIAER